MYGLLGSNIMKGDINIHRVSVNYISECMRAVDLLCYGELDLMSILDRAEELEWLSHLEQFEEQIVLPAVLPISKEGKDDSLEEAAVLLGYAVSGHLQEQFGQIFTTGL